LQGRAARGIDGDDLIVFTVKNQVRFDRYHAMKFLCESWSMRFRVSVRTSVFIGFFAQKCAQIRTKPKKTGKKPVETREFRLTKRSERMKVNCGTVLRTRMNIGDFALKTGCGPTSILQAGQGSDRNLF
jgi:hypothetical protein